MGWFNQKQDAEDTGENVKIEESTTFAPELMDCKNYCISEQFAQTINWLKGKVTTLFITHQLPKGCTWMR